MQYDKIDKFSIYQESFIHFSILIICLQDGTSETILLP